LAALATDDLAGRHVLVTAGPTREHLDPVRFLSNPSSGRMGDAVARQAWRRGAQVTLVSGPTALTAPPGIERVDVTSAAEMAAAVDERFDSVDVVVMTAAVADFRPAQVAAGKVAKEDLGAGLTLERTDDILAGLGARKVGQLLVGFAMETDDLEARAAAKLARKNLDLIVANDLTRPGAGFGHDTNEVVILAPDQDPERLSLRSKEQVAERILDRAAALLEERR
ncbi:MAG: bifunctional phosphopantothenoylcysteine decarboxylase/phosphopantothenate--cysteine ligase CoaBC, partial [Myxococcota bacterium]|nr:bifunctional phosphopantothenoylcysteine decarboxylase/phosphopantothenate--cysteine ligase CoaBC [Myxococcota bacterium]